MSMILWPEGAPLAIGTELEDQPRLDHYPVQTDAAAPALIICPGGGYEGIELEHEGEVMARWINKLGITAFILHYRVKPYGHPCPLMDAQRAVRYIRHHSKEFNIDPNRIGMIGFSAGGHLACTTGTHAHEGDSQAEDPIDRESCKVNLLVLGYCSLSFMKREYTWHAMMNLIGENPTDELRRYYSNEFHVTEDTPPVFMWTTSNDRVQNSLIFGLALKEKKIKFELHCYENGPHGMGLAQNHPYAHTWTDHCAAWLRRNGF